GVEYRLAIGQRSGDDLQDLTCGRLLVSGFGEFALQVRIGYRWRSSLRGLLSRCPTPRTKLSVCYRIVLLAPKTLHAEASRQPGRRRAGQRITASGSRGQEDGDTMRNPCASCFVAWQVRENAYPLLALGRPHSVAVQRVP